MPRAARRRPKAFQGQPHAIVRLLGIRFDAVTRRRIAARMRVRPMHLNRSGRVNGGIIMAFADVLGAAGTIANLPPGFRTSTLESKTNFFAAGRAPFLHGVSVPLHIGRSTMVWQTTVRNDDGTRVAIVTQTQIVLPEESREPARRGRER
jgi:uncharacterized protein (TIGR00369 family)